MRLAATREARECRNSGSYSLSHAIDARVEWHDSVSRGRNRAAPLPTHLLRICAGTLKRHGQCAVSKLESGQSPTSSRQGVLVCGALRLPHDLICLPLLFPQNSLRDFCGNPERQESAFSPLNPPQKNTSSFFGGSGGGAYNKEFCQIRNVSAITKSVFGGKMGLDQQPLRLAFGKSPSRAVETALGQEMARSMCHFQARKRSKPHRGFAKKALSRPLHRGG